MSLDPSIDGVLHVPKPSMKAPEISPESEPKSTILFWAVGIIILLIVGIFLIRAFYHPAPLRGEIQTYHGWEFEKVFGLWQTIWQQDDVQLILNFHYLPQESMNTTVHAQNSWNATAFDRDKIIIAFDPSVDDQTYTQLAATEIAFKLSALGVNVSTGYTKNSTGDFPDRPIVSCKTPNTSVIILSQASNGTATLYLQDTCMTLTGEKEELLRATDRVLYAFYGIATLQ